MRSRLAAVALSLLLFVVAACSNAGASPTTSTALSAAPTTPTSAAPAAPAALTIYGAASLKGVLDKVKAAYETANPGSTLTISTDSSATLETQIEQGARPTSSCRPTRRTRKSSSTRASRQAPL
jgi:molybdate transport system substrate-binding protein